MWSLYNLILILRLLLFRIRRWIHDHCYLHQVIKVPELNQHGLPNNLYNKVNYYVNSLISLEHSDDVSAFLLFSGTEHDDVVACVEPDQPVSDSFLNAQVTWTLTSSKSNTFCLRIRRCDRRRIVRAYFAHIVSVSDEIDGRRKELKLYLNNEEDVKRWRSVPFTHPTTMETIAMDVDLKNRLKTDLETFAKSRNFYHRQGRVWKRSYLLYGPSGTGKSSFIAAMANFLSFDVYDVDVTKLANSSELKTLLLNTTPRSIIAIEDLDRYIMNQSTDNLTGLLNFMDGILTGCCGDERVMVYTISTEKEKIDSSVLRPGRVDVHVNFPLSDFASFKMLANSYLNLSDHKLFGQVKDVFMAGARLSAAEISELMIVNRNSPKRAIKSVIGALQMDTRIGKTAEEEEEVVVERSGELKKLLLKVRSGARGRWMSS